MGCGASTASPPIGDKPLRAHESARTAHKPRRAVERLRFAEWARSFMRQDPRREVHAAMYPVMFRSDLNLPGWVTGIPRDALFAVFRPTSLEAIRKMWLGLGVGKGLNVKGKSAKCGELSGFVPFLQISERAHAEQVEAGNKRRTSRIRIYFGSYTQRAAAAAELQRTLEDRRRGGGSRRRATLSRRRRRARRRSGRGAGGAPPLQPRPIPLWARALSPQEVARAEAEGGLPKS